jgi:hypothetical protein
LILTGKNNLDFSKIEFPKFYRHQNGLENTIKSKQGFKHLLKTPYYFRMFIFILGKIDLQKKNVIIIYNLYAKIDIPSSERIEIQI